MDRIDHRLYGYIDGAETCSAARWAEDAKAEIAAAQQNDILPILVGGTGLYVRTLLNGIAPIPEIDTAIRLGVRELAVEDAYTALRKEDPASATRLNAKDSSRVKRALEVVRSSGKPLDHWHAHMAGGIAGGIRLHPLVLLPPRDWLYERCERRFQIMLDRGAKNEVLDLIDRKLSPDCPVMRAIGVPEISAWIAGSQTIDEAQAQATTATRQYAKRQYTWFRNQSPDHWNRWNEIINNDNLDDIVRLLQ